MSENSPEAKVDFDQFAKASSQIRFWIERWHQSLSGVPFEPAIIDKRPEQERKAADTIETLNLLVAISIEVWTHRDSLLIWNSRIIQCDPAGSHATTPGLSIMRDATYRPGVTSTAHGSALNFLENLSLEFFEDFLEKNNAQLDFKKWHSDLIEKCKEWARHQSLPSALEIGARMEREFAYVDGVHGQGRPAKLEEQSHPLSIKNKIADMIKAGHEYTNYIPPSGWQKWLGEKMRPNSPNAWAEFKTSHNGEDHPEKKDRLVRFPTQKLVDDSLIPPMDWLT